MTGVLDSSMPGSVRHAADCGTEPDQRLVERASELVGLIRRQAAKTSEQRFVAAEVMQALEDAELFGLLVPRRHGGHAVNLRTTMEVIAEVARGDGSTAWALTLLNVCTWFATTFSDEAQDDVFGQNPKAKVCGIFTPPTTSERVDGGYSVSGKWPYSSGSFAADWATLGIKLDVAEGEDARALALIPSSAWTIEPTWFVTGMKGSGSDTIVVENHFVPDHRVQRFTSMQAADYLTSYQVEEQNSNMPFISVAALILVAPQVGLARHAAELTLNKLPEKGVAYTVYGAAKNSPAHQLRVAEAITKFDLAELLMQRACYDIDKAASLRQKSVLLRRARLRNDTGTVAELVKDGIDLLLTANGAGSFADANVLSRVWRDCEIAARHAYVSSEVGKEVYGRLLLGADGPATMDV